MLARLALIVAALVVAVAAIPEVALPFNSQVPVVARIAEPYKFQLAPTTFTNDGNAALSYTLIDAPAWLALDSRSLTLYGTPGQGDSGSNTFSITASDTVGSTNMACTLIVTNDAPPIVTGDISAILSESGMLSSSTTLTLSTEEAFTIAFGKDFFRVGTGKIQAYYATLSDHTPLPSWLDFDDSAVAFLGVAPAISSGSQSWTVNLIASDVLGFSGVVVAFTLSISTNNFSFTPQSEDIAVTTNTPISFESLIDQLSLNGRTVSRSQIQSASIKAPSWLSLKNDTLFLSGIPPTNFHSQDVKVTLTDIYGDVATKSIHMRGSTTPLIVGDIENMTATAGKPFTYKINPSMFRQSDLNISVDLGAASSWLRYGPEALQLRGSPPVTERAQTINLVLHAATNDLTTQESRTFEIRLQAAPLGEVPTSTTSISRTASSEKPPPTSTHVGATNNHLSKNKSTKAGIAIGVVVGCIAFAALVAAVAMLLCSRRRKRDGSHQPGKLKISRPTPLQPGDSSAGVWGLLPGEDETRDLEKCTRTEDRPPRLDLPLESGSLQTPRAGYQRSMISSIGDGEAALHNDPNIPVWGVLSTATHTPHHSYSAATELARKNSRGSQARLSQFARLSPPKKRMPRLQSWHSPNSTNFRTSLHSSILRPSKGQPRLSGSGLSASRDYSSGISFETHGTSLLSTRASDFPEPPSLLHHPLHRKSAVPNLTVQNVGNRRSIRLVSHSNSISDDRPLTEKRQSFIRNRASSSVVSPLFASSRRASAQNRGMGEESSTCSNSSGLNASGNLSRNRSQRTFFSASNSLEPPARNPRRLASNSSSFAQSFRRPGSGMLVGSMTAADRGGSPVRGVIPENGDADVDSYTSTTTAASSSSPSQAQAQARVYNSVAAAQKQTETANAEADFVAQLTLPRHERSFVLPGEASPTPPPSTYAPASTSVSRSRGRGRDRRVADRERSRDREAARRKWASRLGRDGKGNAIPQEESPVKLKDVAQRFGRRKREEEKKCEGEDGGGGGGVGIITDSDMAQKDNAHAGSRGSEMLRSGIEGDKDKNVNEKRGGAERLSLLVSKDSINGPMRKKADKRGMADSEEKENEELGAAAVAGAAASEGNESEWEDVASRRSSWMRRPGSARGETPNSTFSSGKAFI